MKLQRKHILWCVVLCVCNVALILYKTGPFAYFLHESAFTYVRSFVDLFFVRYPEAAYVTRNSSFADLAVFFADLTKHKGAAYAYQVLHYSLLAPEIDSHLLGHVIGDELYRKQGLDGMQTCTPEFHNACSHAIVIGMLIEKGEVAFSDIVDVCRNVSGGKISYPLCFHGLGHGVLAYTNYNMEKAVTLCKRIRVLSGNGSEQSECMGGVVMELVSGGFHDKELWGNMRAHYLDTTNPLSFCRSTFIPDNLKQRCFFYISPFLVEAGGGNRNMPNNEEIEKAFQYCKDMPPIESQYRDACFGGFGVYVSIPILGRDIRAASANIYSNVLLKEVYNACLLAHDVYGTQTCVREFVTALYWGGENNVFSAIQFCSTITDGYDSRECFNQVTYLVGYYRDESWYHKMYCNKVPVLYQIVCKSNLGV